MKTDIDYAFAIWTDLIARGMPPEVVDTAMNNWYQFATEHKPLAELILNERRCKKEPEVCQLVFHCYMQGFLNGRMTNHKLN